MSENIVFLIFIKNTIIFRPNNWILTGAKKFLVLKGLVHGFGRKIEVFLIGVFHRNPFRKHRFWYWGTKRMILRGKKKVLKRAKKFTFSKGVSPWIWSKDRTFSYGRFSQKSYQKTSSLMLWKEKNDFKRKKLKF